MGNLRAVFLILLSAIFLPLCVSTPINYDTAEIPDDSTRVRVGGGVQGFKGKYTMSICGYSSTTEYSAGAVRGDVQISHGIGRVVEMGVQGGASAGGIVESDSGTGQTGKTEPFLQADLSPYFKVGLPSRSFRFSFKLAPQVLLYYRSPNGALIPSAYADLLFGYGSPEWITTGLRFSMIHGVGGMLSLHRGRTTFSFMALFWPGNEDNYLSVSAGLGFSIR